MTTRPSALLISSASANFLVSLACLFAGDEMLGTFGAAGTALERALVQLLGAGLFGFAMLNWMSRYAPVGGIYGRPLVVANLAHTVTAALTMLQVVRRSTPATAAVSALVFFGAFAIGFGVKLFRAPGPRSL